MRTTKEGMTIKAMKSQLAEMRRIHREQENTLMVAIERKQSSDYVKRLKRVVVENGL